MAETDPAIEPDVLIIGGGVTGRWVLKKLVEKKYSVVLLEKLDADCQTHHSHAYVHGGHFWSSGDLVARVQDAQADWQNFLSRYPEVVIDEGAHLILADDTQRDAFEGPTARRQWPDVEKVDGHSAFPEAPFVRKIPETWTLHSGKLVDALSRCSNSGSRVRVIDKVTQLTCHSSGEFLDRCEIEVTAVAHGIHRRIIPKALVFAAGSSNGDLVSNVKGEGFNRKVAESQQLRLTHMLLLEGNPATRNRISLPEFTGQINLGRNSVIFVASRASGGQNVWLVTNGQLPKRLLSDAQWVNETSDNRLKSSGDDKCEFLNEVLQGLKSVGFGYREEDLLAGIYPAIKSEWRPGNDTVNAVPRQEAVKKLAHGVYAIWPTLLTLAPVAANTLVKNLEQDGLQATAREDDPLSAWTANYHSSPRPELWTITERLPLVDLRATLRCRLNTPKNSSEPW